MTETSAHFDTALTSPAAPITPSDPHWLRTSVRRQPLGTLALTYLVLLVVAGLLAPQLAPYDPAAQDLRDVLSGPSAAHWLGTDTLGRDVLSRVLYGITPSLVAALQALVVFLLLGVPLGILTGYLGGRFDAIVGRTTELLMAIPPIIIVLVVLAVFSASPTAAMVTLGVLAAPGLTRVVRASTLAVRQELFVTAARISGVGPLRIMSSHVLRRVLGPVLAQASLFAGIGLAFQAALSFLGLLSGDSPRWGSMIGEAAAVITRSSWLLIPPGLTLALTVLAFGLIGDAVRDLTSGEAAGTPHRRRRPSPAAARPVLLPSADPGTPADALLDVRSLTVVAGPDVTLVSDVSFVVLPGETVAVVGESGCGKSMTALAVLGLLPTGVSVTNGQVRFYDRDLVAGGSRAYATVRGSGIAYISQDALGSLDPTHTVASQLREIIGRHERLSAAATRARAIELLQQVGLIETPRVLASYPHEISGGMAQRVSIALALAGRPQLLIADEPTTALDVTVQAEILGLLRELQDTTQMAILLITHDWGVVADIAHRAVVMYAGEVVEQAEVTNLFDTPRFPYTAALLGADPGTAAEGARLPTLPGRVAAPGTWPKGCRFAGRCAFVRDECTAGPIPLIPVDPGSKTRCMRVDELVHEGALPR